ncbi:MAG: BfmA/BtgA family mobilization protein [Thermonemataceae bacterium]|nr:BfmA/BtgA family mobilization protein [Thermonemataceae bacterium]
MSTKTLKISEESKKDLDALCEFHQLNIGEAVEAMINFFHISNQNPAAYKNIQDDFELLVSQQLDILKQHLQTQNELIIRVIEEQRAEQVAKRANELFKNFKTDLESKRQGLVYASVSVETTLKTYQKRFEALEKENSTLKNLLKPK